MKATCFKAAGHRKRKIQGCPGTPTLRRNTTVIHPNMVARYESEKATTTSDHARKKQIYGPKKTKWGNAKCQVHNLTRMPFTVAKS